MKHISASLIAALCLTPSALADDLAMLAESIVGSWSSEDQSVSEAYDWVESETVRIWADREDGLWLYQENAIIGSSPGMPAEGDPKSTPYFQIIIQIRDLGDGKLHTTSYRMASMEARAGAKGYWRDTGAVFETDWLGEVACMGSMQRIGAGYWSGETECPNGYKGGVKVDSRSMRTPDSYVNWDRGFDAEGNHIWGPANGGYIFKRVEDET